MIAKKLLTTIAFAFVLLFSGCEKDDFVEVDGVCPLVVSTVPEDGAIDVPLNQIITATFNEKMNPATITGASFTVSENGALINGTVSYNGLTATFEPESLLEPDTEYTGTITTLAKDERGNALQENYVWTFTTLPEYTVTIITNPTPGPITTGAGVYLKGTAVTITAALYENYTFTNWTTEGGALVSNSATYILPPLMGDLNLVANYTLVPYEIILKVNPDNTGTTEGAGFYNFGSTANVKAIAEPGYTFSNWTENSVIVPLAGADYSFTVSGTRTLVANFVLKTYTLTVIVVGNGSVAKDPVKLTYTHGDIVKLTPTALPGNQFTSWSGSGTSGNSNPLNVTMDSDKIITATFSPIQYTITLESDPAQGTTEGAGLYNSGTSITVKAIAEPGYTFSNWTENDVIVLEAGADYIFTVTEDRILTANFTAVVLPPPTNAGLCPSPAVDLGLARNYAILAETGISATIAGPTSVTGDMGISPYAAIAITGFDLILDSSGTYSTSGSTSNLVTGKIYASDYTPPTPTLVGTAVDNMKTAFTTANGLAPDSTEFLDGNLNGQTLAAGTYKWGTDLSVTNSITLDGGNVDCAAFVFQIKGKLIVANGTKIILTNGAKADNIYWVVAGSGANLGTTVQFEGNILSQTLISVNTGSTVNGRLLAQTAVTLDANTVVKPSN